MRKERMILVTIIIVLFLMFGTFMVTIANSKNDKKDLIAIFYYTPDNPYTNDLISFNDESISSHGPVKSWLWGFGDGNTSTEQNPTHSYAENTTYNVSLEVTAAHGLSNDTFQHIVILNRNPISNFSYSPDNPTDLQTVNFTDLSNDTDGNITSWYWMFGDENTSTIQNPSHQYSDNGTFTVTLNVTDNDNATNETSQQISILNVGPTSNFNYTPSIPMVNETVQFNDTSTDPDGNITSWLWDFGDETNSTDPNPTHQYADNGTYTVTLTVTDDDGYNDSEEKTITITRAEDVESPSKVTGLTVTDAKDGKLDISWNPSTDNVAVDYYNVYHDGPTPSPIVVNHSTTNYYTHIGLTNGQEYTYNVSAVDTSGNEGEKSDSNSGTPTATDNGGESPISGGSPGGGSHGGGGSSPSPPTNQNPIANTSAGEPYMGVICDEIIFNGSLSNDTDGVISSWNWNFGDGTNGSGEIVTHVYSTVDTFDVVLTVIDDDGATDSCDTVAVISQPNIHPTSPEISGPAEGSKNIEYEYTFVSTDADNDTIKYIIDWDDGTVSESSFLSNGAAFEVTHSWNSAGKYTVIITADDNRTSISAEMIVMIDAIDTGTIGYELPIFDTIIVLGAFLLVLLSKIFWKRKENNLKKFQ